MADEERTTAWFRCTTPGCYWSGEREVRGDHAPLLIECPWCNRPTAERDQSASAQDKIPAEEFFARIERDRPDRLTGAEIAKVAPQPWFTRHGSGGKARIRLAIGDLKYERRQGDDVWVRVDDWTMGAAL